MGAQESLNDAQQYSAIWACLDSNQGPRDYESPALTAVLQARRYRFEDSNRPPLASPARAPWRG
jgi:hypothetical protein